MTHPKLLKVLSNLVLFALNFFIIADKQGRLVKFKFNRAQLHVHEQIEKQLKELGYVRVLILKGRQQGISTYIQCRFFWKVITTRGVRAFILTHLAQATASMFGMTKRYNANLPAGLAPLATKDNQNQLLFDSIGSGYTVGTAGSGQIGRSMTNQLLHLSEYAFYTNTSDIKLGLEQTVADLPGTEKIKESTANGIDNAFYTDWQAAKTGESDWLAIFVPWYWQDEYTKKQHIDLTQEEKDWLALYGEDGLTIDHLAWRRNKLADFDGDYDQKCKRFRQEYPFTDEEAFLNSITDTFITTEPVMRARKADVESDSQLVIGVDPARGGNDNSAIIRRRGRKAFKLELFKGLTTMELVGRVKTIIDNERPVKVFIDCIGIGAGVVDRLHEMGYQDIVVGVNVARSANNNDRFLNLRAELWSDMRDWFNQDMLVDIPDDPELQKDICSLGYGYNSSGKLYIESKEHAKGRGLNSPDRADALMVTFAFGQHAGASSFQPNFLSAKVAEGLG